MSVRNVFVGVRAMTASSGDSVPSSEPASKPARASWFFLVGLLLLALVVGDGLAVLCAARWEAKISALETRVKNDEAQNASLRDALGKQTNDLNKVAGAPRALSEADDDGARLKALEASVQDLQAQAASVDTKRISAAVAVAFAELRLATNTGAPFENERASLRHAAEQDTVVAALTAKLEPLAVSGAPTLETLRELFLSQAGAAQAAAHQAEARTWQDRLLAKMESLISIRPLHNSSGPDLWAAIDADLAAHRLASALDKAAQLPEAAQSLLKTWREQALRRQEVETIMKDIAARLLDTGKV